MKQAKILCNLNDFYIEHNVWYMRGCKVCRKRTYLARDRFLKMKEITLVKVILLLFENTLCYNI